MNSDKKYRIKSGYLLREIAGEYAIIPVDEECVITNAIMVPNDTAAFLWNAFTEAATMEQVVGRCLSEYDAPEDVIGNAVQRFVEETLKYNILEEVK